MPSGMSVCYEKRGCVSGQIKVNIRMVLCNLLCVYLGRISRRAKCGEKVAPELQNHNDSYSKEINHPY